MRKSETGRRGSGHPSAGPGGRRSWLLLAAGIAAMGCGADVEGGGTGTAVRSALGAADGVGSDPTARRTAAWHPVRVNRDGAGWPHHFQVWNGGGYQPAILVGYENIAMGESLDDTIIPRLDGMAAAHANFARLWLRPSDGFYAYHFEAARAAVDLDLWNDDFFNRLNTIIQKAQERGIVLEVMLWDRTTGWRGDGLPLPTGWDAWHTTDDGLHDPYAQNVHHPHNHYRSSDFDLPIPGLLFDNEIRIENDQWYDTGNAIWMAYQQRYVDRVMDEVTTHDNVTLEIINESPGTGPDVAWRQFVHSRIRAGYPGIVLQSEAIGGLNGTDDAMRAWGAANVGLIDVVATHANWSFHEAQEKYHAFRGVLPGCNENGGLDNAGLAAVRRAMWGLVFGGGAVSIENVPASTGGVVTAELQALFHPPSSPPPFWTMRPDEGAVSGNAGAYYVLASNDRSQVLVFVSEEAGAGSFHVNGSGGYQYRWFNAAGAGSSFGAWQTGSGWNFSPGAVNRALQIVATASPPGAPSNLRAAAQGLAVTLTWTDGSSDETGFAVQRAVGTPSNWVDIGTAPANATTFVNNVPAPPPGGSATYFYRVRALSPAGPSQFSNEASVVIYAEKPAVPVLQAPIGCIATTTPTFSWSVTDRATRYYIAITRADIEYFFVNDPNVTTNSYPPPPNLIPGVQYRWKVKACNNVGCGDWAPSAFFTPFCAPTQPPVILGPAGCIGTSHPTVVWSAITGATDYQVVLFQVVDVTNDILIRSTSVPVPATTYVIPDNLVAGQEYRVKVKAVAGGASGPYSLHRYFTPFCTATQKAGTASPIAPLGGTTAPNPLGFSWEVASNTTAYQLNIANAAGPVFTTTYPSSICAPTECSVTGVTSLPAGPYYWQLRSSNPYGSSFSPANWFTVP